jgi:hypothetical protein
MDTYQLVVGSVSPRFQQGIEADSTQFSSVASADLSIIIRPSNAMINIACNA